MEEQPDLGACLARLNMKTFLTLKMSQKPSPEALKIGCSLVALFFEKLEKPIDSQEILEVNEGLNKNLYSFYFGKPLKMFKQVKQSIKMVQDLEVPFGNIRFARMVLRDVRSEELDKKGPVFVALRTIHAFLLEFIRSFVQRVRETGKGGGNICKISLKWVILKLVGYWVRPVQRYSFY